MKCFFHKSDLDGMCSGAIVKKFHPNCEMVGVDYQDSFHDFEVHNGEDIIVVDFSFPMIEMDYINNNHPFIWIDHHKSTIEEAFAEGFLANGGQSLEVGTAACELTWEYFYPEREMPEFIHLLGRYDVWDHEDERVLQFQYGMRQFDDTSPAAPIWHNLLARVIDYRVIIDEGKLILAYQNRENRLFAKGMAFVSELFGLRAICVNKPYSNSKIFDSVYNPDHHDIMVVFGIKRGTYKYSVYCDKSEIDVGKLCKMYYGGGGHPGAGGFHSDQYLFKNS